MKDGSSADLTKVLNDLKANPPEITNADMGSNYSSILLNPMMALLSQVNGVLGDMGINNSITTSQLAFLKMSQALGHMFSQGCTDDATSQALYEPTGEVVGAMNSIFDPTQTDSAFNQFLSIAHPGSPLKLPVLAAISNAEDEVYSTWKAVDNSAQSYPLFPFHS